jgi:hypothetical protein
MKSRSGRGGGQVDISACVGCGVDGRCSVSHAVKVAVIILYALQGPLTRHTLINYRNDAEDGGFQF